MVTDSPAVGQVPQEKARSGVMNRAAPTPAEAGASSCPTGHSMAPAINNQIVQALAELRASHAAQGQASKVLEAAFEAILQDGLKGLPQPPGTDHLREHRRGVPSRRDTDAALRSYVIERSDHMAFPHLARAVAEAFPAERRVSQSAIHRWWKREGHRILANRQKPDDPR